MARTNVPSGVGRSSPESGTLSGDRRSLPPSNAPTSHDAVDVLAREETDTARHTPPPPPAHALHAPDSSATSSGSRCGSTANSGHRVPRAQVRVVRKPVPLASSHSSSAAAAMMGSTRDEERAVRGVAADRRRSRDSTGVDNRDDDDDEVKGFLGSGSFGTDGSEAGNSLVKTQPRAMVRTHSQRKESLVRQLIARYEAAARALDTGDSDADSSASPSDGEGAAESSVRPPAAPREAMSILNTRGAPRMTSSMPSHHHRDPARQLDLANSTAGERQQSPPLAKCLSRTFPPTRTPAAAAAAAATRGSGRGGGGVPQIPPRQPSRPPSHGSADGARKSGSPAPALLLSGTGEEPYEFSVSVSGARGVRSASGTSSRADLAYGSSFRDLSPSPAPFNVTPGTPPVSSGRGGGTPSCGSAACAALPIPQPPPQHVGEHCTAGKVMVVKRRPQSLGATRSESPAPDAAPPQPKTRAVAPRDRVAAGAGSGARSPSPAAAWTAPDARSRSMPTDEADVLVSAVKYTFDAARFSWSPSHIMVRILHPNRGISQGGMRVAFEVEELDETGCSTLMVAKFFRHNITNVVEKDYFSESEAQCMCEEFANSFNKVTVDAAVEKANISFLQCSVVRIPRDDVPESYKGARKGFFSYRTQDTRDVMFSMEPKLTGNFTKYTSNFGDVYETNERYISPAENRQRLKILQAVEAFSHFTLVESGGSMLVCDLQGVNDFLTDPQIHTEDGEGLGMGNMGQKGIAEWIKTHRCKDLCRAMRLQPLSENSAVPLDRVGSSYFRSIAARLQDQNPVRPQDLVPLEKPLDEMNDEERLQYALKLSELTGH